MEAEEPVERRRGQAAGHRAEERLALEFGGAGLELLLHQVEPEQPVRLALEALDRERLQGLLAGVAGLDQPVEEHPGGRAVALGLLHEPGPEVVGGGGGPLAGDLRRQVAPADLALQVGPGRAEAREGGLGLGVERRRPPVRLLGRPGQGFSERIQHRQTPRIKEGSGHRSDRRGDRMSGGFRTDESCSGWIRPRVAATPQTGEARSARAAGPRRSDLGRAGVGHARPVGSPRGGPRRSPRRGRGPGPGGRRHRGRTHPGLPRAVGEPRPADPPAVPAQPLGQPGRQPRVADRGLVAGQDSAGSGPRRPRSSGSRMSHGCPFASVASRTGPGRVGEVAGTSRALILPTISSWDRGWA